MSSIEPAPGLADLLTALRPIAENAANLLSLIRQLKTRIGVVPFVGAGMSVPFGFPAWRAFLESQAPDAAVKQQIAELLDAGAYEEAAELLQTRSGESAFQAALKQTFGEHRLTTPLPEAAILQLPRFSSGPVLTTNFDPVLETVFDRARRPFEERILGMNVKTLRNAFDQNRRVLLKLHGDAADQSSRVLTRSDYERAYGEQEPLKAVLRFAMQARPVLFLGCSLGNDRTVRVLEALAGELRSQKAGELLAHYAVMERPAGETEFAVRHERLKRLGISPIWYPHGKHHLVTDLSGYLAALGGRELICGQVPPAPLHYLERSAALAESRAELLTGASAQLAITSQSATLGVQGMGGVGKTVLAAALTRDAEVQRAFSDGIFWLTVGQQPNLLGLLNQLAEWVTDGERVFTRESAAQSAIREALAGRRVLLVLDDVWQLDHAAALNLVCSPARLLISTRKREVLAGLGAKEFCLGVLPLPDAIRMLADWADVSNPALLPPSITEVAQECGCLPLALAMIGAMVRVRHTAWPDVLEFLLSRDLEEFRHAFPGYPYPDLLRAIAVSVDELPAHDADRYLDLAVFPDDLAIGEAPLQVLWNLTPAKTRACMDRLAARSLATIQEVGDQTALRIHSLQGDYIRKRRESLMPSLHGRLLEAYASRCPVLPDEARVGDRKSDTVTAEWPSGPNDGYFFQQLTWHLAQAGRSTELRTLLFNFRWLQAKLNATNPVTLLADFDRLHHDEELAHVQSAIRLGSHRLTKSDRLAGELLGRLGNDVGDNIRSLVNAIRGALPSPSIEPLTASLAAPTTILQRTITTGTDAIEGLALAPDGKSALVARGMSGSANPKSGHLAVFEAGTGEKLYELRGHTFDINQVAITPDGTRAISASGDKTVRIWNLATREVVHVLKGHKDDVKYVATNGEHVVAGTSKDFGIRVWHLTSGKMIPAPHLQMSDAVGAAGKYGFALLHSKTLCYWELEDPSTVRALADCQAEGFDVTADGTRAVTIDSTGKLTVWDLEKRTALYHLDDGNPFQEKSYHFVKFLGEESVVSLSGQWEGENASVMNVWNLEQRTLLLRETGHTTLVTAFATAKAKPLVATGILSGEVKIWNLDPARVRLAASQGERERILAVALQPERSNILAITESGRLRIFDLQTLQPREDLEWSVSPHDSIHVRRDGLIFTWRSRGSTLEVRTVDRGLIATHQLRVTAVAEAGDGENVWILTADHQVQKWRAADLAGEVSSPGPILVHQIPYVPNLLPNPWGPDFMMQLFPVRIAINPEGKEGIVGWGGGRGAEFQLGGWDFPIVRLDLQSGEIRRVRSFRNHQVKSSVFTENGKSVLSATYGQVIKWATDTMADILSVKHATSDVLLVASVREGRSALSVTKEGEIQLWDQSSGERLADLFLDQVITSAHVTDDGRMLVIGTWTGDLHLFRIR